MKIGPSSSNACRRRSARVPALLALKPSGGREKKSEAQWPEQMRREDDVVETVPNEHALNFQQSRQDA